VPGRTDFRDVDHTADPTAHVGYLDAASAVEAVAAYKRRSIELLAPRGGDHVLEVGCGNGDEARVIAARVAPGGSVTAIDLSEKMIEEARARGAVGVTFTRMDAHDLRFADESFDGCRVDRTLQHVEDPGRVVHEMVRVLRRGRRLVAIEPDWETMNVSAKDAALSRRIIDHAATAEHRHGRIGRRLPDLLAAAGLDLVAGEALIFTAREFGVADHLAGLSAGADSARAAGVVTPQEAADWLADLAEQGRRGTFIGSLAAYMVTGEKPAVDRPERN
jgi:SAM-dependent methyltransferase